MSLDIFKYFNKKILWQKTDDVEFPYVSIEENEDMKIRLNDFPEEAMYSLFINNDFICDFDDFPINWDKEASL